ncbi:unnamed protein product [Protopolystoma xenopodis]|uniref:Uncharacterized protein n=1 Tax=Protopolystoma xenopodis TaxID=117903 RepID=A0A3S5BSK7_9PLAT|nr:unnamed protein product [Protopolystoma xenopodis]
MGHVVTDTSGSLSRGASHNLDKGMGVNWPVAHENNDIQQADRNYENDRFILASLGEPKRIHPWNTFR